MYINKYIFVKILQNSITVGQATITIMTQQDSSTLLKPNSAYGRDSEPNPELNYTRSTLRLSSSHIPPLKQN